MQVISPRINLTGASSSGHNRELAALCRSFHTGLVQLGPAVGTDHKQCIDRFRCIDVLFQC